MAGCQSIETSMTHTPISVTLVEEWVRAEEWGKEDPVAQDQPISQSTFNSA